MTGIIKMEKTPTGLPDSFNNAEGVVSLTLSTVAPPFGYYFPTDFPEIKKMTRLIDNGTTPISTRTSC